MSTVTITPALMTAVAVVAAGLVLCFLGYAAMRLVFALLGGVVGWQVGQLLGQVVDSSDTWQAVLTWGGAVLAAVALGTLAYSFYVAGVLLAVGRLGYGLGEAAAPLAGLSGWWVVAAAVVAAGALVAIAFATKLPRLLLVIVTAVLGAMTLVTGILALTGLLDITTMAWWKLPELLGNGLAWNLLFLALTGAGIAVQLRSARSGNLRAAYA